MSFGSYGSNSQGKTFVIGFITYYKYLLHPLLLCLLICLALWQTPQGNLEDFTSLCCDVAEQVVIISTLRDRVVYLFRKLEEKFFSEVRMYEN